MVIDQVFDSQQGRPMPDEPQRCVLAYPHAGRYLTFDGRLGHGVLGEQQARRLPCLPSCGRARSCRAEACGGSTQATHGSGVRQLLPPTPAHPPPMPCLAADSFSRSVRATLLVNWWAHQPQAVHELSAADVAKFGWSLLGDTDASNASSSAAQQPAGAPSSADGCGRGDHGAASPGAAEERLGSVVSDLAAVQLQDSCRAVELPIQQLAVPADEQEAVLVSCQRWAGLWSTHVVNPRVGRVDRCLCGHPACTWRLAACRDPRPSGGRPPVHCAACRLPAALAWQVDEVLRDAGVGLTGGAACSAVAIDHIGYVMCPLDAEQDLDPELQTAAVFILASMLSDSGSEGASTD